MGCNTRQVSVTENRENYDKLKKEDNEVCEALAELFQPEMEEAIEKTREEVAVDMLRDNKPVSEIHKYTKVTSDRIAEIAKDIGIRPVLG